MLQLVLQPLDKLRVRELVLFGALQSPLPRFDRLVDLLQFELHIPEMVPQGRVSARVLLDRLFDRADRFVVLAELEEHPSEAVEIRSVVGFRGERLADHLLGPFEVLPLVGPQVAKVVVELGVIRVGLQDFLQDLLALAELALLDIDVGEAELAQPHDARLVQGHVAQFFEPGDGLVPLARVTVDPRLIEQMRQVARFQLQRLIDRVDRVLQVSVEQLRAGQHSQQVGPFGCRAFFIQGILEQFDRGGVAVSPQQQISQLGVERDVLFFSELDGRLIELDGVVGPIERLGETRQDVGLLEGQLR